MENKITTLNQHHSTAERLKNAGQNQAAGSKTSLLKFAKSLAVEIALSRPDRTLSADDVQAALVARGISDRALGGAAGALFRGREWEWTGRFTASTREHGHGNLLRVWRYVGKPNLSADNASHSDARSTPKKPGPHVTGGGEAAAPPSSTIAEALATAGDGIPAVAGQRLLFALPSQLPD